MSRIAEMVNAEADAAEAEDAEAEDETPEPDAEPEREPEASSNVNAEKAFAKIEAENARHAKRIAEIMGDDFSLTYVCQGCVDFAAGFTLTPPDEAPPLVHSPEFVTCDRCNGYGLVLTGARNEHGQTTTCRGCSGQGFKEVSLEPAPLPPMPNVTPNSQEAAARAYLESLGAMVIPGPPPAQAL